MQALKRRSWDRLRPVLEVSTQYTASAALSRWPRRSTWRQLALAPYWVPMTAFVFPSRPHWRCSAPLSPV